ncbi:LCP family protein [Thomasclavelia sp.]|uniref:LCP family protein n=1 Tax=Thomasclavelia sp. TaxID=3025757 RepID=UPI0025F723CD|nr:LCP family protein [Thomasclavelia sp.]
MKKNKFIQFITSKYLILAVQLIATAVFTYLIFELNLVPLKYLIPGCIALCVLIIIFFFIMRSGQKKIDQGLRSKRSIITKLISLLVSILLMVASSFVVRGNNFFNNVSEAKTQNYLVSVITMKDHEATKLKDLDGAKFGISYQYDTTTVTKAIADMEDEIGEQKNMKKYDDYTSLADALYDGEVDAIIAGQEYKSMLEANHEGFDDDTKIIKSYEYESKLSVTTKQTNVTQNSFTIYVTGIDTYGSVNTVSRSDVNLIVTVNPIEKQILMTSIPRDCEIELHKNGEMDKLTHTGIYGTNETISTIEDFLDVQINYFARTNFSGITNIVDALGGVTIDSDYAFTTLHGNYEIVKGENEMDGDKALCFVRERYALPGGDFDRGKNQQKLLKAMLDKAMSAKIITNFNNILSAIEGCFETDMSSDEIKSLLNMQLDDMADWEVFNVQVDGKGYLTSETYSMSGTEIYVMKPYKKQLKQIKEVIDKIESGERISEDDVDGLGN